ncbi:ribosomal protein L12E/L44/L45/RPP1/RPP2 [Borreliella spielmanii]|uniref:Ribosomal protein L12E/L44/L45/RPP1/RPP2 n=1 Tax=Borreliella spielmanii TaxID=88916 RepID=A0ABR6P7D8_9SPIR|nr:hypothetical protein [Borreliella spielmanii]MBB6031943.1 ribosomal protein L12E/L44/L45/RPP1/RPP2 [Borreliella spielmanii]
MKYNIIASMFVFLFLTSCNPDFSPNQKEKTSKETSTLTDLGKSKIPVSRSRKSAADLSGTDIATKIKVEESVNNKRIEESLSSINGPIDMSTEESSRSTESINDIEAAELLESTKSQGTSSIKGAQSPEKTEQKLAKTEEKQRQEEEKQRQEEEKRTKDTIEILTKKIDEINRDIDAIKHKSLFLEDVKREIVAATEARDKITGPIYDHFTDGSNAIHTVWYDVDTDLKELLEKLRDTRSNLRAKLNVGNQRYTWGGNEPNLKENVKVVEIESDLDKLKSELKGVKEYLKNKSNFEKIKENIVNSDDE